MSNEWPHLTVPVMNDEFTRCREQYLGAFEHCGANAVFLAMRRSFDPDFLREDFRRLAENIALLKEAGYEAGCWLQAFGFGNPLPEDEERHAPFTRITGMDGRTCGDAFCPADPSFTAFMAEQVRRAARAGARLIMLDDDLCLNIRPGLRLREAHGAVPSAHGSDRRAGRAETARLFRLSHAPPARLARPHGRDAHGVLPDHAASR